MANGNVLDDILDQKNAQTAIGQTVKKRGISRRANDVAGSTPIQKGRTTLRREVTDPDFRPAFRKTARPEDVTKTTAEIVRARAGEEVGVKPVTGKAAVSRGTARTATPFSALERGGQTDLEQKRLGALGKAKPGERIGGVTIASQRRAQESRLGPGGAAFGPKGARRRPSIFSPEGFESFFQQAVKDIPQFQRQIASQKAAGASRKGARADTKAKTERLKVLLSEASKAEELGNVEVAARLRGQAQDLDQPSDPNAILANRLAAADLPRELITQIMAALGNEGANQ